MGVGRTSGFGQMRPFDTDTGTAPVGDGAMDLWVALDKVFPQVRHQRCWFHKIGNVLNVMPKSQHAKAALAEIWNAATRADAIIAFNQVVDTYAAKYPRAIEKLAKGRASLLAFYDFRAEHWQHVRTTNPIESTFATVRHSTSRTRNCLSRATFLGVPIMLIEATEQSWRKILSADRIELLLKGAPFKDGIPVIESTPAPQPLAA
ncbi:transposase, mutator type [Burkholderia paludis]|uniref:Mutator family transposase n=1 Tax=Burkholderia paludis TaxID=1506587 RepID=A0A6P2SCL7_9BURK|nr:hypothetical protein LMG30113_03532 [Burkholderia paludis]VWC43976.1 transposase, mutator type [Burkholderia paludis]